MCIIYILNMKMKCKICPQPKTRHQRPYGWENGKGEPFRLSKPPSPPSKFASLPYDGKVSFNWIDPLFKECDNIVKIKCSSCITKLLTVYNKLFRGTNENYRSFE